MGMPLMRKEDSLRISLSTIDLMTAKEILLMTYLITTTKELSTLMEMSGSCWETSRWRSRISGVKSVLLNTQ